MPGNTKTTDLTAWAAPISTDVFPIVDVTASTTKKITFANLIANLPGALLLATTDNGALGSATKMWSDLFLASGAVINFNNGNMTITHAAGVLNVSTGLFCVNETANANMTTGVTLNQGAADDEILALKSSDIAHGRTTLAETDTYALFKKGSATGGGLQIMGISDTDATTGNYSLQLLGYTADTALDTTKSTSGLGAVVIAAGITDGGTTVTTPGADENLMVIQAYATTRFIFDTEGSGHSDVGWVTYDSYDDLALVRDMEQELLLHEDLAKTERRHMLEQVGIIGKDSWHMENGKPRAMVNFTKLAMLHHGALLQASERFTALERSLMARIEGLERQVLALQGG